MNKFKICPECGTKNPPDVSDCINCDCDLMSVPVTDEQQKAEKISAREKYVPQSSLVKICSECGEKNLPNARKCSKCGEDISDILPTPENTSTTEREIQRSAFSLQSLDGRATFTVDRDELTVGREHEWKDYLAAKTFVSRRHCKFTVEAGELFVEDLNSANSTYVNNQRISAKTKLTKGDEVGLGGAVFNGARQDKAAYFLVR